MEFHVGKAYHNFCSHLYITKDTVVFI